jgi:hypothetical protein
MTDLDVREAAKTGDMVDPAVLAARMTEERAPDIVEAVNDMPPDLAVAVLLQLPPDRAIGSRKAACRNVRGPRRRHFASGERAALLRAA